MYRNLLCLFILIAFIFVEKFSTHHFVLVTKTPECSLICLSIQKNLVTSNLFVLNFVGDNMDICLA